MDDSDGSNAGGNSGDGTVYESDGDGYNGGNGAAHRMVTVDMVMTVLVVILMRMEVIMSMLHMCQTLRGP